MLSSPNTSNIQAPLWQHVSQLVSEQTSTPFKPTHITSVSGGDISRAYVITGQNDQFFIKLNDHSTQAMFKSEQMALNVILGEQSNTASLAAKSPEAPKPIAPSPITIGTYEAYSFIILEYLPLQDDGDDFKLGQCVAQLHQRQGDTFGWPEDNFIGTTSQTNTLSEKWSTFWIESRMKPQLKLAIDNGYGRTIKPLIPLFLTACETLLKNHTPPPSLLHGDLWRGNAGFANAEPFIFDPASYFGDRETDIALTELFGGFSRRFYQGYSSILPLDDDYAKRKPLYNLYHLLNHLNLFGTGYLRQVTSTMTSVISDT